MSLCLIAALSGCGHFNTVKRETLPAEKFREIPETGIKEMRVASPFLKLHMRSGSTYVLRDWEMDDARQQVTGTGALYDAARDTLGEGRFRVGVDSVALFETNVLEGSKAAAALTIFLGVTAVATAVFAMVCISNPKACFGSCPTFYASDGDSLRLQAEGFSASIAPSLEATDVDALFHAVPVRGEFEMEMRNEALETHVVRQADLLAVERPSGRRVFADLDGRFWEASAVIPAIAATGEEGDCLAPLLRADGNERFSRADSTFLGAKETVELTFEGIPRESIGLVVGCRQTLLSTYLLYQTLAYMGNDVGRWFAEMERGRLKLGQNSIQEIMGGIEVLTQNGRGEWAVVAELREHGPLAVDFHLIPLPGLGGDPGRVRLRMTKGNWRVDYVALAVLDHAVRPDRLQPWQVLKDGAADEKALEALCDAAQTLTTFRGDVYTLRYRLPTDSPDYELFLESRGYYLEWIRPEWIAEENPALLAQVFLNPEAALTRLAPEFKRVEPFMEDCFWRSRYAKP